MSAKRVAAGLLALSLSITSCAPRQSAGPTAAPAPAEVPSQVTGPATAPLEPGGPAEPEPSALPNEGRPAPPTRPVHLLPVLFDDDGSPDGTTALLYLLSRPDVSIRSVSISYGEAYPEIYNQYIGRTLDDFGRTDIPLGAGQAAPLAGDHAFPEWMRGSANGFWGLPVPNADKTYPAQDAADLMIAVIGQSPEPVTIFVSGPATNVAQALRLDPDIRANIATVVVMGGAVYVPGNIADLLPESKNAVAEWNIYADPQAARELFASGLDITLVPLDATNQVSVSRGDTRQWRRGGEIADFAADIYDMLLDNWGVDNAAVWDVMTAAIAVQPDLCGFQALHLEVVTDEGSTSGQTVAVAGEAPNAQVCLHPDVIAIRQALVTVFSSQR